MILISRMLSLAFKTVNADKWSSPYMAKKDPFPNEWEEVFNLSEKDIESPEFIVVLEDSVVWDLPDPFCCIVRSYNRKDNTLREYAYKREGVAQRKIQDLALDGLELTILTKTFVATINYNDETD
jgi:hypothetical protein